MSYKCEVCQCVVGNSIPSHKLVVEKRQATYKSVDKKTKREKRSTGWEIVQEVTVCNDCKNLAYVKSDRRTL